MNTRSRAASQTLETASLTPEVNKNKKAKTTKASKNQNADTLVANILSSIGDEQQTTVADTTAAKTKLPKKSLPKPKGIRGKPKSGRPWKDVKEKFSNIKKSIHRRSFEKKEELRSQLKHIKELSKSIKEDKRLENVEKKQRRGENAKRRLENERKSEIVQIIKNPAKLKRMKKKALRKIEKRDLTNIANGPKVV